jgi:YgiT-type zinc finger domain-containing protein
MEVKISICPTCGSDKIKRVRRKWTGLVQGKRYTVPSLEFYECPSCGERVYDREAMRKIEARSPAFPGKKPKPRVRFVGRKQSTAPS